MISRMQDVAFLLAMMWLGCKSGAVLLVFGHVLLLFLHTAGSICDFVLVFYMRDRGLETVLCRSDLLDCDNVFPHNSFHGKDILL